MAYRWRATFNFDYPLLDQPIDIGDIRLCPAPPELDLDPHAVHYYEFETIGINRNAQEEARQKCILRLEELIELSVLSPYYTEVGFHSLVLVDSNNAEGYPPSGINFNPDGVVINRKPEKPYIVPGQSPRKFREQLVNCAQAFVDMQSLSTEVHGPISRALRWIYRGIDYRLSPDDKLIYHWIAFNSLYGLFNALEGQDRGERSSVRAIEAYFRPSVGSIGCGEQQLSNAGLRLNRGSDLDVSADLQQSIANNDDEITRFSLECVYAARCSLFHGAEKPVLHVPNSVLSVSAVYLEAYLKKVIPVFIVYCKQRG